MTLIDNAPRISVSTAAFDGYEHALAFDEMAKLGVKYVEPAYIHGYVVFDESAFTDRAAQVLSRQMADAGVAPLALSAHIDAGEKDAVERLRRRLGFAAQIGAHIVITNATTFDRQDDFRRNVAELIPVAQDCDAVIAFENPGHGAGNLIGSAVDGVKLRAEFDSPWIGLNYDTGNVFTYSEERLRPEFDIEKVLPIAAHFHLKDVLSSPEGWSFTAIGEGSIDFTRIAALLAAGGNRIPVGIELPLRLRRAQRDNPRRDKTPLPLDDIRSAVARSLRFVNRELGVR